MATDTIARALAIQAAAAASSSGVPWITPAAGEYIPLFRGNASASGMTAVNNRIWFTPILLPRSVTISKLASRLITAGSSNTKLGVYNANQTTKRPTTLLGGTGNIANNGSGGNYEASISGGSVTLLANTLYFTCLHNGDGTACWQGIAGDDIMFQVLKPPTALADITSNTGEVGIQLYYGQTFASGLPDMTALTPTFAGSGGFVQSPAVWGLVA